MFSQPYTVRLPQPNLLTIISTCNELNDDRGDSVELFEIKCFLRNTILSLKPDILMVNNDDVLSEIGVDSSRIIELVIFIEEEFGFEFESSKLTYTVLRTIDSISEYVWQRIKDK